MADKANIFESLGNLFSLTGAGLLDPAAPYKIQQQRQLAEEQARQQEIQNAVYAKVLGVDLGGLGGASFGSPSPTPSPQDIMSSPVRQPTPQEIQAGMSLGAAEDLGGLPPTQLGVTGGKLGNLTIGQTPENKISQNIFEAGAKEGIKTKQDVKQSSLSSQFNLNLVSENIHDLASLLASAYEEGGAGDIVKSGLTNAAINGLLPQQFAEKFSKASAVPGKKIEIISKMFPTLTQQIGKEGSVRLIESVFNKLGKSLPGLQTAPKLAVEQMDASIQTMYRINRALEEINLDDFDLETKAGQSNFEERVAKQAENVRITGEEKKAMEKLKSESLKPLNDFIKKRDSGKGLSSEEQAELEEINRLLGEL